MKPEILPKTCKKCQFFLLAKYKKQISVEKLVLTVMNT